MKVIGVHAIALAEEAKKVMAYLHRCREDFDVNVRISRFAAHLKTKIENYKSTLAYTYT